jgi:hypothetical protein
VILQRFYLLPAAVGTLYQYRIATSGYSLVVVVILLVVLIHLFTMIDDHAIVRPRGQGHVGPPHTGVGPDGAYFLGKTESDRNMLCALKKISSYALATH